jgi:hypothetical protein
MAEPNFLDVKVNLLRRWLLLQKLTQHFWQRWSSDYLTTLQKCSKTGGITNIQQEMLVILKENNIAPTQWLLSRVVALHPGQDNVVRVVSLKTKNGIFKRLVVFYLT